MPRMARNAKPLSSIHAGSRVTGRFITTPRGSATFPTDSHCSRFRWRHSWRCRGSIPPAKTSAHRGSRERTSGIFSSRDLAVRRLRARLHCRYRIGCCEAHLRWRRRTGSHRREAWLLHFMANFFDRVFHGKYERISQSQFDDGSRGQIPPARAFRLYPDACAAPCGGRQSIRKLGDRGTAASRLRRMRRLRCCSFGWQRAPSSSPRG